jgi:hypothetical protein
MTERKFDDPVIELAVRLDDDQILLGGEVTPEDAEIALAVLDEVEAKEQAASIVQRLRQQGHTL